VITAGLDLAAMPERTALASIEWAGTRAVIRDLICPAGDGTILEAIAQAGKTGIDCPLGWPDAFADFVAADDLLAAAPWLDYGPHEETIRRSHDAFDAVIAALTARAASRGQTCPPGDDDLVAAAT
jgi:predicted nuclease with RNAse H fold